MLGREAALESAQIVGLAAAEFGFVVLEVWATGASDAQQLGS
jgi:hypothetical protein